jgi:hypothetical protein
MELQSTLVHLNNDPLTVHNIYIPPTSSCPPSYKPDIRHLLLATSTTLILGDLNAHDDLWYSSISDSRGADLSDQISQSNFMTINTNFPTRLPHNISSATSPTSPDISISTTDIGPSASWSTLTTLNSDHLPILISLPLSNPTSANPPLPRRTFTHFNKPNWPAFTMEIESSLTPLTNPLNSTNPIALSEFSFRSTIQAASKHHIPQGNIKNFSPGLTTDTLNLISKRDALRFSNPSDPLINSLNLKINQSIDQNKRTKWISHLASFDHKTDQRKLWNTIKDLNTPKQPDPNSSITFLNNKTYHKNKDIARALNHELTSVHPTTPDKLARKITRSTRSLPPSPFTPFTTKQVYDAIHKAKNSPAVGPDAISSLHLKHLGPTAISALTEIINTSIQNNNIPQIWKNAITIPIPKPDKDPSNSSSYRPISLLSPIAKTIERLLLPTLQAHLPSPAHQHGFKPLHSTTTALENIAHTIASGFNHPRPPLRTIVTSLDLTKAFDTVNLTRLKQKVLSSLSPTQ